jgi:vitamin B12 transporter
LNGSKGKADRKWDKSEDLPMPQHLERCPGKGNTGNMKYCTLFILSLVYGVTRSNDTIPAHFLPQVEVVRASPGIPTLHHWQTGTFVDSTRWSRFSCSEVGRALEQLGMVNLIAYGANGGASYLRTQGMAPDHSVIQWNGVSLNSPTLGLADLSLVPVFFFENVGISSGLPDANDTRSGLAGTFDLKRSHFRQPRIHTTHEWSSLQNAFTGGSFSLRGKWGTWTSKVFFQNIRNRYEYTDVYDIDRPRLRQEHHQGQGWGSLHEWSKQGKHEWNVSVWNIDRSMELPQPMGIPFTRRQFQDDQQLRASVSHSSRLAIGKRRDVTGQRMKNYGKFQQQVSYLRDAQTYEVTGAQAFQSSVVAQQAQARMQWQQEITDNSFYSIQSNVHSVEAVYDGNRKEKLTTVGAGAKWSQWLRRFNLQASTSFDYRNDWGTAFASCLQGIHSAQRIRSEIQTGLKASRKVRLPDMNELFWVPGGNRDLLPETSMGLEGVARYVLKGNEKLVSGESKHVLECESSPFVRWVDQWIQWVPNDASVWTPVNFKQVHVFGADITAKWRMMGKRVNHTLEGRYSWISAKGWNDEENARSFEMVYTPRHRIFMESNWVWGKWQGMIATRYVSERFTDEANSARFTLNPYLIADVSLAYAFDFNNYRMNVRLALDNANNAVYESMRAYAMPGRVFRVMVVADLK